MTSPINSLLAREHSDDLLRAAERGRLATGCAQAGAPAAIELRLVRPDEAQVARRLAELDDAAELEGQVLLALIDGVAVAGLSLCDRRVVANPFVATGDAVALLRLRGELITSGRAPRRRLLRSLAVRAAA